LAEIGLARVKRGYSDLPRCAHRLRQLRAEGGYRSQGPPRPRLSVRQLRLQKEPEFLGIDSSPVYVRARRQRRRRALHPFDAPLKPAGVPSGSRTNDLLTMRLRTRIITAIRHAAFRSGRRSSAVVSRACSSKGGGAMTPPLCTARCRGVARTLRSSFPRGAASRMVGGIS